jgi:hypothetical protein
LYIVGTSIGAADATSTQVKPLPIAAPASAAEPARNSRRPTMLAICFSMPYFENARSSFVRSLSTFAMT